MTSSSAVSDWENDQWTDIVHESYNLEFESLFIPNRSSFDCLTCVVSSAYNFHLEFKKKFPPDFFRL